MLKKYSADGKVVIVAGAGISKEKPSFVPSWWEYNMMLLRIMGEVGAQTLNFKENLLDVNHLDKYLAVTTVSELIVDRFASDNYYPLIEVLEATIPNINHLMMAKLSKDHILRACITTNFDTLIERAFNDYHVPINVSDHYEQFLTKLSDADNVFSLLKIHGSVANSQYAIDTVRQKIRGLDEARSVEMKHLFEKNHVLFLGFSGDDFLIDSDYIPISSCKNGITWISYPGSKLNPVVEELSRKGNFEVVQMKLPEFYQEMGWRLDDRGNEILEHYFAMPADAEYMQNAEKRIRQYYSRREGTWGCVGACLGLIANDNKQLAEAVCDEIKRRMPSSEIINPLDLYKLPALTAAIDYELRNNNTKDAESLCELELEIMRVYKDFLYRQDNVTEAAIRELCFNFATVLQNAARISFINKEYSEALDYYEQCFKFAYKGHTFQAMSTAIRGIAICKSMLNLYDSNLGPIEKLYELHAARNFAVEGGHVDAMLLADGEIAFCYLEAEDYSKARKYYQELIDNVGTATIPNAIRQYIDGLSKDLLPHVDEAGKNIDLKYVPRKRSKHDWQPFTSFPVLKYAEGVTVKQKYDGKGIEEAYSYIKDYYNKTLFIKIHKYNPDLDDKTAAMIDCFVGLAQEEFLILELSREEKVDFIYEIRECDYYLLEYNLRFYDYLSLVRVLGEIAYHYTQTISSEEDYRIAEFAAKSCIAMHPEGTISENYIKAVSSLIYLSLTKKNIINFVKYADELMDMPEDMVEEIIPGFRAFVSGTLGELRNISIEMRR